MRAVGASSPGLSLLPVWKLEVVASLYRDLLELLTMCAEVGENGWIKKQ